MRAMRVHELGGPLWLDEIAVPEPGPGALRLRVLACGLNFADTLMAAGKYQEKLAPPFAPGLEVCGVVEALGPGAEGFAVGDRVAAYAGAGGWRRRRSCRPPAAWPRPRGCRTRRWRGS